MKGYFSLRHRVLTGSEANPASYPMRTVAAFSGSKSGRCMKLTTHFHLVPQLRMSGAMPSLTIRLYDVVLN
jgi:hypothetical protein